MKTAIYIEQGVTQLVLTPENDWEKSIIKSMEDGHKNISIYHGGFYYCQGGWDRHSSSMESLILRMELQPKSPIA